MTGEYENSPQKMEMTEKVFLMAVIIVGSTLAALQWPWLVLVFGVLVIISVIAGMYEKMRRKK